MSDKLAIIVQKSGLDSTKAQVLLDNFSDYFTIAAEWEKKAKAIVVTDVSQTAEMQMARAGRLYLREKRLAIERTRKMLKESAIREGKAIDGVANVLKAVIVPIEDYLEEQEKFAEAQAYRLEELARIEADKKLREAERLRKEAEAAERNRIYAENEKLRAAALAKDRKIKVAQAKADAARKRELAAKEALEAERQAAEEERLDAQAKAEREAREERLQQKRRWAEERELAAAEKKILEDKILAERQAAEVLRLDAEKEHRRLEEEREAELAAKLAAQVRCPYCQKVFTPGERTDVPAEE